MKQTQCLPCYGVHTKTGKPAGALHKWGPNGVCEYCQRMYGQVHFGKVYIPQPTKVKAQGRNGI